jgi:hypothetical protein
LERHFPINSNRINKIKWNAAAFAALEGYRFWRGRKRKRAWAGEQFVQRYIYDLVN